MALSILNGTQAAVDIQLDDSITTVVATTSFSGAPSFKCLFSYIALERTREFADPAVTFCNATTNVTEIPGRRRGTITLSGYLGKGSEEADLATVHSVASGQGFKATFDTGCTSLGLFYSERLVQGIRAAGQSNAEFSGRITGPVYDAWVTS